MRHTLILASLFLFAPLSQAADIACPGVQASTPIDTADSYSSYDDIGFDVPIINPYSPGEYVYVDLLTQYSSGEPAYLIDFANGATITSSSTHIYIRPDKSTVLAKELKVGDEALDVNLKGVAIKSIKTVRTPESLFNVGVSKDQTLAQAHVLSTFAILSGDCYLQQEQLRLGRPVKLSDSIKLPEPEPTED